MNYSQSNSFELDRKAHVYRLGGRTLPGVTGILASAGLIDTRWFTDAARARGTAVHQAAHYLDEGDLDWDTVDDVIKPYVRAYQKFKKDANFQPIHCEVSLYHPTLMYAGTFDRVGQFSGTPSALAVLDLKSGKAEPWAGIQVAGYRELIEKNKEKLRLDDGRRIERYVVELRDDESFRLTRYADDDQALSVFISALNIRNWKEVHR